jgi:hypothetical protein
VIDLYLPSVIYSDDDEQQLSISSAQKRNQLVCKSVGVLPAAFFICCVQQVGRRGQRLGSKQIWSLCTCSDLSLAEKKLDNQKRPSRMVRGQAYRPIPPTALTGLTCSRKLVARQTQETTSFLLLDSNSRLILVQFITSNKAAKMAVIIDSGPTSRDAIIVARGPNLPTCRALQGRQEQRRRHQCPGQCRVKIWTSSTAAPALSDHPTVYQRRLLISGFCESLMLILRKNRIRWFWRI